MDALAGQAMAAFIHLCFQPAGQEPRRWRVALDVDFPSMLRRRLEENWMYPFPKDVEIHYSSLGGKAVAYGAAGMILDRLVSEQTLPGLAGLAGGGLALAI